MPTIIPANKPEIKVEDIDFDPEEDIAHLRDVPMSRNATPTEVPDDRPDYEDKGEHGKFVTWWRPFIGWVAAFGLVLYFFPKFILAAVFWVRLAWGADTIPPYPVDESGLTELVCALLGLGALKTVERGMSVFRPINSKRK